MAFPANVVEVMRTYLPNLLDTSVGDVIDGVTFVGRPIQPLDPNPTVSCYAADWNPQGYEIGQFGPALTQYTFIIQMMNKHMEEEEARELHGVLATALRLNIFQNENLKDALLTLSHTALGHIERVKHYGVTRQRFFNNDVGGEMLFLTNIEFWVNIEQVPSDL